MLTFFRNRSLQWWLWAGLIVSSIHLIEEVTFFKHTARHYVWFGFGDPSKHMEFAWATVKQTLFHVVMIAIALWVGGRWLRYVTQFFAVILLIMSGLLFVGEALYARQYVSGVVTGVFLVTPFFVLCLRDLVRTGKMTVSNIVCWSIATPLLALAIIYGILV